jgi:hypothetical protein
MLKKKVIAIKKLPGVGFKCGECLHFKQLARFEKVCSQLAVKHYADAPTCFSPNAWLLKKQDPNTLFQLGLMLNSMTGPEVKTLMGLMMNQSMLIKRYGLKFGQPVFFCLGSDYLSNYFRGFVIGGGAYGEDTVHISSTLNMAQRKHPMQAMLGRDSVYTNVEFKKQKAKLIKADRIVDPKPLFSPTPTVIKDPVNHVPVSMDTAPPEWFDKTVKRPKIKSVLGAQNGEKSFKVKR